MLFLRLFFLILGLLLAAPLHAAGIPQALVHDNIGDDETPVLARPPQGLRVPAMAPARRDDDVEKNELAAPVLTNYGVLNENSGSMPMDIWKPFSYLEATAVLHNATQNMLSGNSTIVLKNALRAAALSKTYEPSGNLENSGAENANSFFNARIFAAQATGDSEGALALLQKRPEAFKLQEWQNFIDNMLRMGSYDEACALMTEKLVADNSSYTQKLGVLCDIKAGKPDAARLHLDVLREAGETDSLFLDLAERALNPSVVPKAKQAQKLENLGTLHLATIALGKIKLKPEMIDGLMSPPAPLLLDISMSDAQRMKFAEGFARTRLISTADYNAILTSLKFPGKAITQFRSNPETLLTVPEKEWPAPLRRAAALRAIAEEENSAQKAHIIAAALPGFTNADLLGVVGDVLIANSTGIAALPDNAAAAPALARLLLLRGDKDGVNWWRMAGAAPAMREHVLPLFPLVLLRDALSEDERALWFERYGRTQALSGEKKSFNLALVKILGVMLPSDVDSQLAAQNVFPTLHATDKSIVALLSNLTRDGNDATLRALLTLKTMRQDRLAEALVLLKF
ncbi:MAG: hypothetical protein EB059_09665 [Alphaproteobacteria bacterium]|nr:hypothetical protein [Alphaproteobacteria bacterium]